MRRVILFLALLTLIAGTPALAQVPPTMSYQGMLTDGSGNPVPDGLYDLTFRIYNVASGGVALYTEAHTGANQVQLVKGGFSVVLGSLTPMNLDFDGPTYLGIQAGANPEMTPRVALASSPYALGLRLPFALSTTAGAPQMIGTTFTGGGPDNLGGLFELREENGTTPTMYFEPDAAGTGGFMAVNRTGTTQGFVVDGNAGGTGEPDVVVIGSTLGAVIDLAATGDATVQLPSSAISAAEELDEPGVASNNSNGGITLDGTLQTIVSRTLTAPADGYVVCVASCQGNLLHTNGTADLVTFGINTSSTSLGATQDNAVGVPANVATGNFFVPGAVTAVFPVTAGAHTFYYLAERNSGDGSVNDATLAVMYFPTAYGTVVSSVPAQASAALTPEEALRNPTGHAMTAPEIAVEQQDARTFDAARANRELDAMRVQLARIQARLDEQNRVASSGPRR